MFFRLFRNGKSVEDPVCKKPVQKAGASATYQFVGETYYFCSERCRDRFQSLPARYLETSIKVLESSPPGGGCGCC
jgi:Cu+-exporting ATPase